jgi:hypothetical protein
MGTTEAERVVSDTADHDAMPLDGTLYTAVGSLPASLNRADDFPAEALCSQCHMPVRAESPQGQWYHTGRKPGDPR